MYAFLQKVEENKNDNNDWKLYLLSVYILTDVSHFLVNLLFMLVSLMELSVGFLKFRLFLLQQQHSIFFNDQARDRVIHKQFEN